MSEPFILQCIQQQISALTDAKLEQRAEALREQISRLEEDLADAQEEHLMILREQQQRRA